MFIIGVLVGAGLMCIIGFVILGFMYKNQKRLSEQSFLDLDIVDEKVKEIIHSEETRFIDSTNLSQDFLGVFEIFKKSFLDLSKNISKQYNPDSKHPEYELTIVELLEINKTTSDYIIKKLNEKPFIILKNLRISQLREGNIKANLAKDFLENNKYGRLLKKITKNWGKISAVNSVYKMVTSPEKKILGSVRTQCIKYGLNYILRGIAVKTLEEAGKELNQVYSGKYYRGGNDE